MNMRKIWDDATFWLGLSKTEHWEKERDAFIAYNVANPPTAEEERLHRELDHEIALAEHRQDHPEEYLTGRFGLLAQHADDPTTEEMDRVTSAHDAERAQREAEEEQFKKDQATFYADMAAEEFNDDDHSYREERERVAELAISQKIKQCYADGNAFRFHPENGLQAKELSKSFLIAIQTGHLQKYAVHGMGFPADEDVSLANKRAVSASRSML